MVLVTAVFGGEWVRMCLQLNKGMWHVRMAYFNIVKINVNLAVAGWKWCTSGNVQIHLVIIINQSTDGFTSPLHRAPSPWFMQSPPNTAQPHFTHTQGVCMWCVYDVGGRWTCEGLMGRIWKWRGRTAKKNMERQKRRRGEGERGCVQMKRGLKNTMKAQHEKSVWTNRFIITGVLKQLGLTANTIFQGNEIVASWKEK